MVLVWLIGSGTAAEPEPAADRPGDRGWREGPAAVEHQALSPKLAVADLRPGTGVPLMTGDLAVVAYVGWLADGSVWDSTLDRHPTGLPAGATRLLVGDPRVPSAWSEGLVGMRVGGVRQLVLSDPDAEPVGDLSPTLTVVFELIDAEAPPAPVPWVARAVRSIDAHEVIDLRVGEGAASPAPGPAVGPGVTVSVDYVLHLADGTEVDSSWRWPEPFTFRVGPAVRWSSALRGMRPGGRRQVRFPASAAYGDEGRLPEIPPTATLVLTVDVREVGG